jgi:hypothetical protein
MREPEDRWMSLSSRALVSRLALVSVLAVALAGAGASGEDASENLDAVDDGESESADEVDRQVAWSPPSCDALEIALGDTPEGDDGEAWKRTLAEARARLDAATEQLARADAAYSQMMSRGHPAGDARAGIVARRDDARSAYAGARCALPALVERARRSGAPADAWRSYL